MDVRILGLLVLAPALLPIVLELALILQKPLWFRWLAFGTIGTHSFTIAKPKREIDTASGYREGPTSGGLPALPEVNLFADSTLFSHGTVVMLQRYRGRQLKAILIRIDARREGDTITLRARRILAPVSIALAALIFCAMCATSTANLIGAIVTMGLMAVTFMVIVLLNADPRDPFLRKAFKRLEREYRRLLEEPIREASEVRS